LATWYWRDVKDRFLEVTAIEKPLRNRGVAVLAHAENAW